MASNDKTVDEAKKAVIEANGKIEDILNELFTEYGVTTRGVDLSTVQTMKMFWDVRVHLDVSI